MKSGGVRGVVGLMDLENVYGKGMERERYLADVGKLYSGFDKKAECKSRHKLLTPTRAQ